MAREQKPIDHLSASDFEIFKQASQNVNYFLTHYLKSPSSGTYYRYDFPDGRWRRAWEAMHEAWKRDGKPTTLHFGGYVYQVIYDSSAGKPIFFLNHGPILQDWQLQVHHAQQPEVLVIGGVGCGKTMAIALSALANAMLYSSSDLLVLAPTQAQAEQTWRYMHQSIIDTEYYRRWVHLIAASPYPRLEVQAYYGAKLSTSRIMVRAAPKHELLRLLTYELDAVYVDQAEAYDNLDELRIAAGTRLRGMVQGRPRRGLFVMIANANENPFLWHLADVGRRDPSRLLYLKVKTSDNPYLTEMDVARIKARFANEEQARQWMEGERPYTDGEEFSWELINRCVDTSLNDLMQDALEKGRHGFLLETTPKTGVYRFEMPPDDSRLYCVVADPGQGNPPGRNAPCIMVWDITEFPDRPAVLRAFWWVFGNGDYSNFVSAYEHYVRQYNALTRNAFDATGNQMMLDQLVFQTAGLMAEGLRLSTGSSKQGALNAAKYLMSRAMLLFPKIDSLVNQLITYKMPEPDHLPQDITMTLAMSAYYITRYFRISPNEANLKEYTESPDRFARRPDNRYERIPRV